MDAPGTEVDQDRQRNEWETASVQVRPTTEELRRSNHLCVLRTRIPVVWEAPRKEPE